MRVEGYPTHLWIEPYREIIYRMCWAGGTSLVLGRDEKLIDAALQLIIEGWVRKDGGPFFTYGQTYIRFVPTEKLKTKELRYAF